MRYTLGMAFLGLFNYSSISMCGLFLEGREMGTLHGWEMK